MRAIFWRTHKKSVMNDLRANHACSVFIINLTSLLAFEIKQQREVIKMIVFVWGMTSATDSCSPEVHWCCQIGDLMEWKRSRLLLCVLHLYWCCNKLINWPLSYLNMIGALQKLKNLKNVAIWFIFYFPHTAKTSQLHCCNVSSLYQLNSDHNIANLVRLQQMKWKQIFIFRWLYNDDTHSHRKTHSRNISKVGKSIGFGWVHFEL